MNTLARIFRATVVILRALVSLSLLAAGAFAGLLSAGHLAHSLRVLLTSTHAEFREPGVLGCVLALQGIVAIGLAGAVLRPVRCVCTLVIHFCLLLNFLPAALLFAFTGLAVITGNAEQERLEHMLLLVSVLAALAVVVRVALNFLYDEEEEKEPVPSSN